MCVFLLHANNMRAAAAGTAAAAAATAAAMAEAEAAAVVRSLFLSGVSAVHIICVALCAICGCVPIDGVIVCGTCGRLPYPKGGNRYTTDDQHHYETTTFEHTNT